MSQDLPTYITISSECSFHVSQEILRLKPDKIAVLVDENTKVHCLPKIDLKIDILIEIKSGEIHKTIDTCQLIWKKLTEAQFSRKSLLINLGGGVIGDMGGFAASTFKRGIRFINIPTTLLSQVDASIGGKLGIDFHGLKNHIGLFREPDAVIIDTVFLETLSDREIRSGFAEIIKHCLIHDQDQWLKLKDVEWGKIGWNEIVPHSVAIKNEIVSIDPLESGLRKVLNFGHTLGHAIESHLLESESPLLHGEAIAIGMILEASLSLQLGKLDESSFDSIVSFILKIYPLPDSLPSYKDLIGYLMQDKKNEGDTVSFSLLNGIGKCEYDIGVSEELIQKSLEKYDQIKSSS